MHIVDLQGNQLAEVNRVYEPNWKPDGSAVVFAQVPEDRPVHIPEVLGISTLDLATGEVKQLTDGKWDDGRPEFSPSGDCVIFVSGGRSGFASFWKVCPGSEPEQLTNPGAVAVDEKFIPTPYDRTIWTPDKRWFVYDFKNGDREEIWGMEFSPDGQLKQTQMLVTGLNPQLRDDGRTVVYTKRDGETVETLAFQFP
jgi:Tol biopolymer transport system component